MTQLSLSKADDVANEILAAAKRDGLNPIAIAILDTGGHPLVIKRQDGATFLRVDVATAKAFTALAFSNTSRSFATMAEERPQFASSLVTMTQGKLTPAPGGLLVLMEGESIGCVGVSGDTSDRDEDVARQGIVAVGYQASE